jgi:hypothetical protein
MAYAGTEAGKKKGGEKGGAALTSSTSTGSLQVRPDNQCIEKQSMGIHLSRSLTLTLSLEYVP